MCLLKKKLLIILVNLSDIFDMLQKVGKLQNDRVPYRVWYFEYVFHPLGIQDFNTFLSSDELFRDTSFGGGLLPE